MTLPTRATSITALLTMLAVLLVGCGTSDPFESGESAAPSATKRERGTIVIGTANFPESEIIGQVWAAALRTQDISVEVKSGIGSREVYVQALEEGAIDVVPEYSGNLAAYFGGDDDTLEMGMSEHEVLDVLRASLPKRLALGEAAEAQSKDAYRVTKATAREHDLRSLEDLKKLPEVSVAGNPELAERPYGPKGLSTVYGVDGDAITFRAISDGGGPLTVKALVDGAVTIADIYTTSPVLDGDGSEIQLVELTDPKGMILPQNVVPLMAKGRLNREARETIAWVNRTLTTSKLADLNKRNIGPEKEDPERIAREFVADIFG